MRKGLLIAIDGIDGCGKSTQVHCLWSRLLEAGHNVVKMREPGDTAFGEHLRNILLHTDLKLDPRTEVLLFSAARAQIHSERINPLLENGTTIITDRWAWSTMAYQGGGVPITDIMSVTRFATHDIWPDISIILNMNVESMSNRIERDLDRFESRGDEYFKGVAARYKMLSRKTTIHIDAGLDRDVISDRIYNAVLPIIGGS